MKTRLKNTVHCMGQSKALIASALALAMAPGLAWAQRPLGVDVSSYQGSGFNWAGEKSAGVTFGWAKATEGTYDDDPDFVVNENNGKAAGVYMGAYHYCRADLDSPGTEASFFWSAAGGYILNDGKTIMPALDFEHFAGVTGESTYSEWANAWCDDIVNDAAGNGVTIRVVLYTSTCEAENFDSSVRQWIPWIANPSDLNPQTSSPWSDTTCPTGGAGVWGSGVWDVWQYDTVTIDEDVFNGASSDMTSTLLVSPPVVTGGSAACVGPIVMDSTGRLEMFGVGSNTDIIHNYQTAENGNWDGWFDMANGNSIASPACNHELDGRLDAFVATGSGKIWHNYQTVGGGGAWNGWVSQAGPGITNIVALTNLDGRLEVFGIGTNGDVWHEWQTTANSGWTTSWSDITGEHIKGGMVGIPNLDGRLEIFGIGANGDIWHNWQTSPGQTFNGWADMGSGSSGLNPRLAIAQNLSGCLEVFGVDSGGNVWHNYQTTPGGAWNGFIAFGGISNVQPGFIVAINKDGRLEMFGVSTSNNDVWHTWQDEPGSRWSNWADLGGTGQNANLMVANNQNGELQLFDIGNNSKDVWSIYQNSPGGSWNSWFDMGGNGVKFFYGQP